MRSARINGGTETVRFNDLVEYNDPESGRLLHGAVNGFVKAGGNVHLKLDSGRTVSAWDARLAKPLFTIRPGSSVTLNHPLQIMGWTVGAGTTVQVTTWHAGIAVVVVGGELPGIVVPQPGLVRALIGSRDARLVRWVR